MQRTLLSLIQEAKPRRALFTSYTFSIFWFETFLLPALRNCGCEQIDVLVDAREAQKSTEEATSLHAGTAYRVIPVDMQGAAVFHPKLVYMRGDAYDSLVVSSANLTLAGHGKNLEVLDAVSSKEEPAVFGEFAAFLGALQREHEFSAENGAILTGYRHRAQALRDAAGEIDETARKTWLIHTIDQPAADQFAVLADRIRRPETLTVLSPYHSPSGQPVQDLAAAVRAFSVRVGVNAKTLFAPFDEELTVFTEPVEYVVAETENPFRFPHAKCFELEGSNGFLVMTGSVNATSQSLETTMNVEVSLVRFLKKSPFNWEVVEPTAFQPCDFSAVGRMGPSFALQATWTPAQRIVGVLKPAQGEMKVELSVWEGAKCLETIRSVPLDAQGAFNVRMKDYFDTERALRLVLRGDGIEASTWINIEFALTADESERKLIRAANRMRAGDYHLDDITTIFAWLQGLQTKAQVGAPAGGAVRTGPGTRESADTAARPKITYDEWRKSVEQFGAFARSADVARVSLEAAFRWLNRDLDLLPEDDATEKAEPPREPGKAERKSAPLSTGHRMRLLTTEDDEYDGDDDEGGDDPGAQVEEQSKTLFQRLMESLPRALSRDAQSAIVPMMVELAGCAVLKRALAHRTKVEGVLPPVEPLVIDAWLQQYSAFAYSAENRERLLPFFCAMACCAAHYHPDSQLQSLKESLERLAGRALAAGENEALARLALGSPRFLRVPVADREAIATSAQVVEMCETLSQQLLALIASILGQATPAPMVPREYADVFAALRQKRKDKAAAFGVVRAKGVECPCCRLAVHTDDLRTLRNTRAFVCKGMYCGRPLFYELDAAQLDRNGLAGRYKG